MTAVTAFVSFRNWALSRYGSVITPNSEVSTMEASNLQSPLMADIWRTQSEDEYFDIDLQQQRPIDILVLIGPKFDDPDEDESQQPFVESDQVTISMSNSAAGGIDVLPETTVNMNYRKGIGYFVWMPTSTVTARYVRVRVNAISRVANAYFDLSYVWLGQRHQFAYNYSFNDEFTVMDLGLTDKSPTSGSMYYNKGAKLRKHTLDFSLIQNSEVRNFKEFHWFVGKGEPFIFSLADTGDLSYDTMLCHFVSEPGLSVTSPITNRTRYNLEEVR